MREIWKKCILLAFVLFCFSLACTSVYVFAIDEDICEAMGGWWIPADLDCVEPFYGNTASEELNSEPADGNASEPVEEEEESEIEEALTEDVPPSEDVDLSGSAGTYIGTTNFDEYYYSLVERGECTENEVKIIISEDGTVDGRLVFHYDSGSWTTTTSSGTCTRQSIRDVSGTFSGQITGPTGTIELETVSEVSLYRSSGCEFEDKFSTTSASMEITIDISEDKLTGSFSSGGDFTFTIDAIKQ